MRDSFKALPYQFFPADIRFVIFMNLRKLLLSLTTMVMIMKTLKKIKRRNLIATNPIMKKGGHHGKSTKALRRQEHQALKSGSFDQPGGFVSNSVLHR